MEIIRPVAERLAQLQKGVTIQNGGHAYEYRKDNTPEMPALPNMCVMEAVAWIMDDQAYSQNNNTWINDTPVCVTGFLIESMIGINDSFAEVQYQVATRVDALNVTVTETREINGMSIDQARTRTLTPLIPLIIGTAFVGTDEVRSMTVQLDNQFLSQEEVTLLNRIRYIADQFSNENDACLAGQVYDSETQAIAAYNAHIDTVRAELLDLVTQFSVMRKARMEKIYADPDHPIHDKDVRLIRFLPDTEAETAATDQFLSDFVAEVVENVEVMHPEYV